MNAVLQRMRMATGDGVQDAKQVVRFDNAMFRNLIVSVEGSRDISLRSLKRIVYGHAKSNGWMQSIKFRHINFSQLVIKSEEVARGNGN